MEQKNCRYQPIDADTYTHAHTTKVGGCKKNQAGKGNRFPGNKERTGSGVEGKGHQRGDAKGCPHWMGFSLVLVYYMPWYASGIVCLPHSPDFGFKAPRTWEPG